MTMASNMNIIDTKDEGIVVKEIPISISDEKLRNSLSCAYEEAQKDILHVPLPCMVIRQRTTLKAQ